MQSKKDFIKLFSKYIITFVFPTLLICVGIISFLFSQLARQTRDGNMNVLEQTQSLIDANMKNITSISYQMSNSKIINEILAKKYTDESDRNFNAWKISQELGQYQVSGTLFNQLAIYSNVNDMIIRKNTTYYANEYFSNFFDSLDKEKLECIKKRFESTKSGFLVFDGNDDNRRTSIYYCAIKSNDNIIVGTLLAVINPSAILKLFELVDMSNDCSIIITDESSNIIFSSDNTLKLGNKDGEIQPPKGWQKLSRKSEIFNINYIFVYPRGSMYGKIRYFAIIIVVLFLCAVLFSAILAKKRADRMNEIVFSVLDENKQMKEGLELQLKEEKKRRFMELLQNNYEEENDWQRQLNFKHGKVVVIILKQSDYCENDIPIYSEMKDEALKRIHEVVCGEIENFEILHYEVRYGTLGYIYALNFEEFDNVKKSIDAIVRKFSGYNILLNIGVGDVVENFSQLHKSYNGAVTAFRYSLNNKNEEAVYYENIQKEEKDRFYYTTEQETLIVSRTKTGQEEKIVKILDDIYECNFVNKQISFIMSKRLIFNMVMTLYKVFDEIYAKDAKHQEYGNRICKNILSNDDVKECFAFIKETLISICRDINKRNSIDVKEKEIREYIKSHYNDKYLSLASLSEELGINYYTLSRLFNEHIGINFVAYLTKYRLEEAVKLLCETDMKIEQVSDETGFYSNSTFIKAFKKYYNETPGLYRKTYGKN